jgi:hypothetical protein
MKTYGGVEVYLHNPWPRYQMEISGRVHAPAALTLDKEPVGGGE